MKLNESGNQNQIEIEPEKDLERLESDGTLSKIEQKERENSAGEGEDARSVSGLQWRTEKRGFCGGKIDIIESGRRRGEKQRGHY